MTRWSGGALAAVGALALSIPACGGGAAQQPAPAPSPTQPPERDYLVFVASEGNDRIALVRFGPGGARVERERPIGTNPTELVGPHGLAVSPDGKWYFVTTAHGAPNGALWKYSTETDQQEGRVELGLFPATVQVAPNGHYGWVVNFNLYGDMVPSSVSVVYLDQLLEVKRIPTCVMPHGSRLSPDGSRHYSTCMMNDVLVEIDAERMEVSRHFMLGKGSEHGMSGAPGGMAMPGGPEIASAASRPRDDTVAASRSRNDTVAASPPRNDTVAAARPRNDGCSPTWAQPTGDGRTVWVACNKSNDLVEIDVASWTLRRRIPAGDGVYNLAVSHDGRLLVGTNKRGQSVSVFETASGKELARIPTTRRVPSGLVISPDDRYVFVTLEGVGSEPGTVDVIDLRAQVRVASVDVGQQAGGIDFWKIEAVK